jgi:hypothetical protein
LVTCLLLLVAAMLALRLVWGWHARRQLDCVLAELERRNEPTTVAAVKDRPLPDADNAAVIQLRAAAMYTGIDCPRNSNLNYPDYPPYDTAWWALANASEQAHRPMMAVLRTARPLRRAHFGPAVPWTAAALTPLNSIKNVANIASDGAVYAHLYGEDDAEALERLHDVFHLANSIRQQPLVVSQLVAQGVDSLGCHSLMSIAPGLNALSNRRPARPEQVRALIDLLLDERPLNEAMVESIRIDRVLIVDFAAMFIGSTWFLRPLADLELATLHRNYDVSLAAASRPSWPQSQEAFTPIPPVPPHRRGRGRYYFGLHGGTHELILERQWRCIAERRLAAIALAMHLYKMDRGRLPATLRDLVPAYLQSVPKDPFHADSRPMGYVVVPNPALNNLPRPLIFFDPGRTTTPPPREPNYGWYHLGGPGLDRQYRDVTRWIPAPVPAEPTAPTNGP